MNDTQIPEENQVQSEHLQALEGSVAQSKNYTAQDFAREYNELVARMGFQISVAPVWIARDDGTWSVQLQTSIAQAPKQVRE